MAAAGPFEILNEIFGRGDMSQFSDQELKNSGFIINRTMSIKYPLQAQSQNVIGVNYIAVVKYWAVNMKGKYVSTPNWTRLPTSKLRKEYLAKIGGVELPEKEILDAFMVFHKIDNHDLKFLLEHKPKEMSELLESYTKKYEEKI